MKKTSALVLAAAVLVGSTTARARRSGDIAAHLPGDTAFLLHAPDAGELVRGLGRIRIGRLFAHPEMKRFVEEIAANLAGDLRRAEKKMGFTFAEIGRMLSGEVFVAVTGLDLPSKDPARDRWIAGCRAGNANILFDRAVKILVAFLEKAAGQRIGPRTYRIGKAEVSSYKAGNFTLAYARAAGFFFVATDPTGLAQLLSNLEVGRKPLAGNPRYRAVRQRVIGERPGTYLYVDAASLLASHAGKIPKPTRGILEGLGAFAVQAAGIGTSLDGEGFRDILYFHAPDASKGVWKLIDAQPTGRGKLLSLVPADAGLVLGGAFGLDRFIEGYSDMLAQAGAKKQYEKYLAGLRSFSGAVGFTLEELGAAVGPEWVIYVTFPAEGGVMPHLVAIVEVRQPDEARRQLTTFIERVTRGGRDFKTLDVRKVPFGKSFFHYVNLSTTGKQSVIAPAFALRRSHLVISQTPVTLKEALYHLDSGDPGLASAPKFRKAAARLTPGSGLFVYADLQRGASTFYNTLAPFFQAVVPKGDVPFEPALMPAGRTLAAHLYPLSAGAYREKEGVTFEVSSPLGPVAFLALGALGQAMKKLAGPPAALGKKGRAALPRVSYRFEKTDLASALDRLGRTGGVRIFYSRKRAAALRVSGAAEKLPLEQALKSLLAPHALRFRVRRVGATVQVVVYG